MIKLQMKNKALKLISLFNRNKFYHIVNKDDKL